MKNKIIIAAALTMLPTHITHAAYKSTSKGTTGVLIPFSTDLLTKEQQTYFNKLDEPSKKIYHQGFDDGRERIIKRFGLNRRTGKRTTTTRRR